LSRTIAVIKREFLESVRTKAFIIGTVLGPVFMIGLFAAQYFMLTSGGAASYRIAVLDGTGEQIGEAVSAALAGPRLPGARPTARGEYLTEVQAVSAGELDAARERLNPRLTSGELDGVLVLPPTLLAGGGARYEGENATNASLVSELRASVQQAVQSRRLTEAGIDPVNVQTALRPVALEAIKTGDRGAGGSAESAIILGMAMGFAIYLVVLLYGAAVMNGVVEEKRDRIVELIVSSIRAQDLLLGKVIGIGGAGILQMTIWVTAAATLFMYGANIAGLFGASEGIVAALSRTTLLPQVPLSVGVVFLLYFAGGFFIYSTIYAILGAVATTAQEAQQLVFPAVLPLILGFFMLMPTLDNPESTLARVGSFIPFTSPMLMPVRHAMLGVPLVELAASMAVLLLTGFSVIWLGGKIYKIGIFATGKRATPGEVWRWIRTA
jgi:ABC-2 type transport system permease protein